MSKSLAAAVLVVLAALALAACAPAEDAAAPAPTGGTPTSGAATGGPPTTGPPTESAGTRAPAGTDRPVPDALAFEAPLVGGGTFDGAAHDGRDVALWFWAPW